MEAKDTAMNEEEIERAYEQGFDTKVSAYNLTDEIQIKRFIGRQMVAKAQAEISFKAGYKEGHAQAYVSDNLFEEKSYMAGKQEGRGEVVEWVNKNTTLQSMGRWKNQLKEWGIEDKKK